MAINGKKRATICIAMTFSTIRMTIRELKTLFGNGICLCWTVAQPGEEGCKVYYVKAEEGGRSFFLMDYIHHARLMD